MKKEKMVYQIYRYVGKTLTAKKDVSFDIKLSSQLILDEICFTYNKQQLENKLNAALETGDKESFHIYSNAYKEYVWE